VYQNALAHELRKEDVAFGTERPILVCHEGHVLGNYLTDLFVRGRLIVQLYAVRALAENDSGIWNVDFYDLLLGRIDQHNQTFIP
jgi:GxxExxY protein